MKKQVLESIKSNLLKELQGAYAGRKTSLPFIVHRIPSSSLVKIDEAFEVLTVGGSIWKKAFCKKTENGIAIVKKENEQSIDFKTEDDFLNFIDRELSDQVQVLTLNFAYPLKPIFENKRLDGILLAATKEGKFKGLVGKRIGKEIETYVLTKRKKGIKVSVANDTICLLLSGLSKYSFDDLAAGIVGTGLNFAFFLAKNRLVNLESASFNKFPQSPEGITVDRQSLLPGRGLFEKETAGAYLYQHFNLKIKEKKISYPQVSSTEELDIISRKNVPQASEIARGLIKRSAQLVACQIAGITEFKQEDQNIISRHSGKRSASRIPNHSERFWTSPSAVSSGQPNCQNDEKHHNMIFNMEGSLFWKGNKYKETVEQTVRQLIPQYNVKFVEIKDSGILGAAKLVA